MAVVVVHNVDNAKMTDGDHDSAIALAALILHILASGVAEEDRNQKHETRRRQCQSERPAQLGAAVLWEDHHAANEAHQTWYRLYTYNTFNYFQIHMK